MPTFGTPVGFTALPNSPFRNLRYRGRRVADMIYAEAGDDRQYRVNMVDWLDPGDTLASVTATVDLNDLVVPTIVFAGTVFAIEIAQGAEGIRHTISIGITTAAGRVMNYTIIVWTGDVNTTVPAAGTCTCTGGDCDVNGVSTITDITNDGTAANAYVLDCPTHVFTTSGAPDSAIILPAADINHPHLVVNDTLLPIAAYPMPGTSFQGMAVGVPIFIPAATTKTLVGLTAVLSAWS